MKKIRPSFKTVINVVMYVSMIAVIWCGDYVMDKIRKHEEKLIGKSEFYHLMYKNYIPDVIKTAEKEFKNLETYFELYKDDYMFCNYIDMEKRLLQRDVEASKDYVASKKLRFKKEGKVLEYKKIDYIKRYPAFCYDHDDLTEFYRRYGFDDLLFSMDIGGVLDFDSKSKKEQKRIKLDRSELNLQEGTYDVFYNFVNESKKIGYISVSKKENCFYFTVNLQYIGEKSYEKDITFQFENCLFERKKDLIDCPYFGYKNDDYKYIIYSLGRTKVSAEASYFYSQDYLHQNQNKYALELFDETSLDDRSHERSNIYAHFYQ